MFKLNSIYTTLKWANMFPPLQWFMAELTLPAFCCLLIGEATNTNFIVFGMTLLGLEPTIYH